MNIPSEQQDSPLILIVDDDKFMRLQTHKRMQKKGIEWKRLVMEECLAAYTRIHPDIISRCHDARDGWLYLLCHKSTPWWIAPVLIITGLEMKRRLIGPSRSVPLITSPSLSTGQYSASACGYLELKLSQQLSKRTKSYSSWPA